MIAILKVCLLLFVLEVAAKPHPAQNDVTSTTVLTETTTLLYTLIPPVLPLVTVSTNRTSSVFTSTTTLMVNLNCTATAYSAIIAPTVASVVATVPSISASIASSKVARQVTTAPLPSSTRIVASNSTSAAIVVTSTVIGPTITATTTLTQRPAVTRTAYSVIVATQATPFTRTVQQCSATQEVLYTIETATVTTTFARTVYPSTTTVVTFVECTPRPSISRAPPVGPSMALSTGSVQSKRQVQVVSTTVKQTRLVYAATTIVMTQPFTRVVTSCSASAASVTAA